MASDLDGLPDQELELCEVLAAYFEAVKAGNAPDRAALLADHPEIADELAAFLEQQDCLLRITEPLRAIVGGNVGDPRPEPIEGTAGRSAGFAVQTNGTDHDAAHPVVQVFGDYELIGEPAYGGMSVVYRAVQRSLNRPVALKMLRGGTLADRDDVRRFRLEAEAIANLDHPNIVPIYEVGVQDGLCYFAMKLIEGGSLAHKLAESRPHPKVAARLAATVARAVHHAHQRGILHRDLKPSNIVIDAEGQPHVTDFGLAKRVEGHSELTQSGAILGTPSYMAPEQASGQNKAITTATDVYGLGAVLYALLTGKPPFKGITVVETLEQVRQQPPEPPSGRGRDVDSDLETICLKCLEKEPDRRYASALEVAEDLERWLRGEPTLARPLSRVARLRRWAWRRRGRLATGAAALLMVGLIGLGTGQAIRLRQAGQLAQEQQNMIREREAEARRAQYVSDIRHASILISQTEVKEARELLDRHAAAGSANDLRGFEWSYLRGLTDMGRKSWIGHEGKEVYHVEYALDGRTFVTAGQDRTARIWDAETGQQRLVLRGHEDEVDDARFDPSGKRVVTTGDDGTVRIWSALDGRLLKVVDRLPGPAVAAMFTPDGRDVIAAARDGTIVRCDATSGRRRAECRVNGPPGGEHAVESIAICPQGTTLALTSQGEPVYLFDLSQGGLAAVTRPTAPIGSHGFCVAFAPDGQSLAATGWRDGRQAVLYDTATGKTKLVLEGPSTTSPYTLAFAPDGRTLACGDRGGTVRIWDLATRSPKASLLGHTKGIWCVAFAPDGRTLATTSRDGTIRLWDSERSVFRGWASNRHPAHSVAFSADGAQLLAANWIGGVLACDLRDGTSRELDGPAISGTESNIKLAPDGSAIVVVEATRKITSRTTANGVQYMPVIYDLSGRQRPIKLPLDIVRPPIWSSDGKSLVFADRSGDLTVWERSTDRMFAQAKLGYDDRFSNPAFLPAGKGVIAFCRDTSGIRERPSRLLIWNAAKVGLEERVIPNQEISPVGKIIVAPDGRNLADCTDARVSLWEFPSLQRRMLLHGHSGDVKDMAFAPDGRTLVTAGVDKTVRLWCVASGQELLVLTGHSGPVRALAFSPDGRMLASCGDGPDGGIEARVWHAEGAARAGSPPNRVNLKED